jgi:hypothetical protein
MIMFKKKVYSIGLVVLSFYLAAADCPAATALTLARVLLG